MYVTDISHSKKIFHLMLLVSQYVEKRTLKCYIFYRVLCMCTLDRGLKGHGTANLIWSLHVR